MTADELWGELHHLFDTDDGSLPESWVTNLSREGVAAVFAFLVRSCRSLRGGTFWSVEDRRERPIDAVPNAAALVVDGRAEPFHVLCEGPRSGDVTLPDPGVFVFDDQIALDYRMGGEWDGARLEALFALLREIRGIDRGARVRLPDDVLPHVRDHFEDVFSRFA